MIKDLFPPLKPVLEFNGYPEEVTVDDIVNTHFHPRGTDEDGDGRAEMLIPLANGIYETINCMGNTVPPLVTAERAYDMGARWRTLVPKGSRMKLRIGGLMTETTSVTDVIAGYDMVTKPAAWDYMKMFIRAASNAHGADVNDLSKMTAGLRAMTYTNFKHRAGPMRLAIHMERKFDLFGRKINMFLREQASVERDLSYLLREVPDAHIIICHVSTSYTIQLIRYLRSLGYNIWGEICPQYTLWNCDDLIEAPDGGTKLNTKLFCLPILKPEEDRRAVEEAMLSGECWWIFGDDEACWSDNPTQSSNVKINSDGFVTGGQTQIPAANISYVIERFAEAGKLHLLNGFLSHNARVAYGLNAPEGTVTFVRQDWTVDKYLYRDSPRGLMKAQVAMGGAERKYRPKLQLAA